MEYDIELKIKFKDLNLVRRFGVWLARIGAGIAGFTWRS